MEYPGSLDKNLSWAEFSYNNSYQEILKIAPFEVLYGCLCHTPLNWIEPREKMIFGPDLVEEVETAVSRIQDNLRVVKSCQESYANKRRRPLEFTVGDHVYLKISPRKGMERFGMKGKLAPRYIGPFSTLEKSGSVAYKLELPPPLAGVHDIFHVSQLKKCLKVPVDVVLPDMASLEADLTYPEHPIKILDQKDHVTRRKAIKFFKVQWSNHTEEEATWESEEFLRSCHPDYHFVVVRVCDSSLPLLGSFFFVQNLGARFFVRGRAVTPLVFSAARNVQSIVLHLVIAGNQGQVNLV
jgi:hypothetical protein